MNELINKLQKYMEDQDLKSYQLAARLGTTESTVSRWIRGKTNISQAWKEVIRLKLGLE